MAWVRKFAILVIAGWWGLGFGARDTPASASPPDYPVPQATTSAGRQLVTDDAPIIGSRPLRVDAWSRGGSDDEVSVQFWLTSPDCSGVHADVVETTESVTVLLRQGTHRDAQGRMCTMVVIPATLTVPLQAPLGTRMVLAAS